MEHDVRGFGYITQDFIEYGVILPLCGTFSIVCFITSGLLLKCAIKPHFDKVWGTTSVGERLLSLLVGFLLFLIGILSLGIALSIL